MPVVLGIGTFDCGNRRKNRCPPHSFPSDNPIKTSRWFFKSRSVLCESEPDLIDKLRLVQSLRYFFRTQISAKASTSASRASLSLRVITNLFPISSHTRSGVASGQGLHCTVHAEKPGCGQFILRRARWQRQSVPASSQRANHIAKIARSASQMFPDLVVGQLSRRSVAPGRSDSRPLDWKAMTSRQGRS